MSTSISRSDGWQTPYIRPETRPLNKEHKENNRIGGENQGITCWYFQRQSKDESQGECTMQSHQMSNEVTKEG